jgi:glycosyltransferase involved in cell wall biosynthesis
MPINILYTIPSLSSCDGIASYAMNYYRRMNHEHIKIDFLINTPGGEYRKEIEDNGGRIFIVKEPGLRNMKGFLIELQEFFKNNHNYDIIHCHVPNTATFYLHYAKRYGIKIRILHSHVTKSADILSKKLRNDVLAPFAVRNATHYAACTRAAGEFLFGRKVFRVINNAMEIERFQFSPELRRKTRNELSLAEQNLVIGFTGRFCNQKNPLFAIDIFDAILKSRKDVKFLLIGEGPLEPEMRTLITNKKLEQAVLFLGKQTSVVPYYQAMDAFLLPSRYEGLGIVLIEAQISGLWTFTSTVVPEETRITPMIRYLDLKQKAGIWAAELLKAVDGSARRSHREEAIECGFDISEQAAYLEAYYGEILGAYS